ncbi:hypothetical protein SAMN05519105_0140 [Rhodobacter sp. 24-YEA-8]|nr:hypothetical protein SAMN05519105_0140 [Rhodobacter sp. 24-YEA-8]
MTTDFGSGYSSGRSGRFRGPGFGMSAFGVAAGEDAMSGGVALELFRGSSLAAIAAEPGASQCALILAATCADRLSGEIGRGGAALCTISVISSWLCDGSRVSRIRKVIFLAGPVPTTVARNAAFPACPAPCQCGFPAGQSWRPALVRGSHRRPSAPARRQRHAPSSRQSSVAPVAPAGRKADAQFTPNAGRNPRG